jgi:anti-sigma factor RsiW
MSECHDSGRCDLFYQALSDFLDGALPAEQMQRLEEHMRLCPPCLVYLEQFRRVYEETGRVRPADLPADFERVMSGVIRAWKAGGRGSGPQNT